MVIADAIVLGGGLGTRFSGQNSGVPKQFQMLDGKPIFIHSLLRLENLATIRQYVLTVPESHIELAHDQLARYAKDSLKARIKVITGGQRRQDSSRLALEALDQGENAPTRVLIHDACRPILSDKLLLSLKEKIFDRAYGAWIPVVPVVETLKRIENHEVKETVDRDMVHRVQTPQIFEYTLIRSLIDRAKDQAQFNFTDDASLCEYYGIPVGSFSGDVRNIKLTYDFEIETFKQILSEEKKETGKCDSASDTTYTA